MVKHLAWLVLAGACVSQPPFQGGGGGGDPSTDDVITVGITGTGKGTVTSSPTGIACPGDCGEAFTADDIVTLTATPDPGSTFVGWTGCDAPTDTTCVISGKGNHVIGVELGCAPGSHDFAFTGGTEVFAPPSCVTNITIDASGAAGGTGIDTGAGGKGGRVVAAMTIAPTDAISVTVGGKGGDVTLNGLTHVAGPGGFNGGGDGTFLSLYAECGAGGGGASDVRINGTGLNDRVVVAAGGGGGVMCPDGENPGADGGGATGDPSFVGCVNGLAIIPGGGSQTAGGRGGLSNAGDPSSTQACASMAGALGEGGMACDPAKGLGGGGGAGYYGGGGGAWTGGAGGSNLAPASASMNAKGVAVGNGAITISW